jgi:hypothetical protein
MQKEASSGVELLIVLLFGLSINASAGSDFCLIHFTPSEAILDLPRKEVFTPGTNYSIPRNQVLLEIGTGTW